MNKLRRKQIVKKLKKLLLDREKVLLDRENVLRDERLWLLQLLKLPESPSKFDMQIPDMNDELNRCLRCF